MPTLKRLSFIGLEYAFAPEKAYGMSRGGGNRRQAGLVEVETSDGAIGVGEAAIFDTYSYVGGRQKGYETWLKAQEEKLAAELKAKLEAAPTKKAGKKAKEK